MLILIVFSLKGVCLWRIPFLKMNINIENHLEILQEFSIFVT